RWYEWVTCGRPAQGGRVGTAPVGQNDGGSFFQRVTLPILPYPSILLELEEQFNRMLGLLKVLKPLSCGALVACHSLDDAPLWESDAVHGDVACGLNRAVLVVAPADLVPFGGVHRQISAPAARASVLMQ